MRRIFLLLMMLGLSLSSASAQLPMEADGPQNAGARQGEDIGSPDSNPRPLGNPNAATPLITTVAGKGIGDGAAATNASLLQPHGMTLDASGDLYIADYYASRIRKVSSKGIITTIAGFGPTGYNGDGIQATNALLHFPTGVALDAAGDIYIADYLNDRIRKINTVGIITTVAGRGTAGDSGDGASATNATLNEPHAVKLDSAGNLYIADRKNNSIRKVSKTGIITTVAGTGAQGYSGDQGAATSATLNNPFDVTVDTASNIFIADTANHCIRKVDAKGIITTVAGTGTAGYAGDGGPAIDAELHSPEGLAMDSAGNLYIADEANQAIRKVNSQGVISTVAGNGVAGFSGNGGQATNASLFYPKNILVDSHGNMFIADSLNDRVRKVSTNGVISAFAGEGLMDNGPATNANFCMAYDVAVDAAGDLFIADYGNSRIREVKNNMIFTVAGNGVEGHWGDGEAATNAALYEPTIVTVDTYGNLFIVDSENDCVRKVDTNGIISTVAGDGTKGYSGDGYAAIKAELDSPDGLAVDGQGNLYISDLNNNVIRKVDTNGIITTVVGTGASGYTGDGWYAAQATLTRPERLTMDRLGELFICNGDYNVIREVDTNGLIFTVAGNDMSGYAGDNGPAAEASLNFPTGVALDNFGNLFIGDIYNERIRQVDINGIITTVAGKGLRGYSGDGGSPTNATLSNPAAVVADSQGNLYIADLLNNCVRKVANGTTWVLDSQIPTINNQPTNQVVWAGGNATFSLENSSNAAYSYQWLFDSTNLPERVITTYAGNTIDGYSGNGGPATNASLSGPEGVVMDVAGNLYIADVDNNVIRKVTPQGIISTVAGNTVADFSGDDGLATNASINLSPHGVGFLAVDAAGNLFISDTGNLRVRKVNTHGIITTVAGNGNSTGTDTGDGGPAMAAGMGLVTGLAVDPAGNLYIADSQNSVVRKVNTKGIISTYAGMKYTGYQQGIFGDGGPATNTTLNSPSGLAIDAATNLYIADTGDFAIRKVNPAGIITTVAGNFTVLQGYGYPTNTGNGGQAALATLDLPQNVAVDKKGDLYFTETYYNALWEIDAKNIIHTVVGDGTQRAPFYPWPTTNDTLHQPFGVTFDQWNNLLISDNGNDRIAKVSAPYVNSSLVFSNVSAGDAGTYQAIVALPNGSVTSSIANLIVADSPLIYQATHGTNGAMTLNFVSPPGSTNILQYTTNLTPPVVWRPLWTNKAAANGDWQFMDTNTTHYPGKFYRFLKR